MSDQQIIDFVNQSFGTTVSEYLRNKNRGGSSGSKGNRYETFYAVYHIARIVPLLNQDQAGHVIFSTQTLSFVDDLIVEDLKRNSKRHYQLKNSPSVAWGVGKHKICDDFRYQKTLNDAFAVSSTRTCLVVPDKSRAKALAASLPRDISPYSEVDCFGVGNTLSHTLQIEPRLYDVLAQLCVEPEPSKVDRLGALIVGEWVGRQGDRCTVSDLWEGVMRHEPNYIARVPREGLLPEVSKILMQIRYFTYTIDKGFFVWQYGECDSGELDYPIGTDRFRDFQLELIAREPRTFAELEELLV